MRVESIRFDPLPGWRLQAPADAPPWQPAPAHRAVCAVHAAWPCPAH